MDNLIGMQDYQSIEYAPKYSGRILLSVLPSLLNLVKQLFTIQMFQDQMNVGLRLKYLIELQHIRMSNFPEQTNLIMNAHHTFNIVLKHCLIDCF